MLSSFCPASSPWPVRPPAASPKCVRPRVARRCLSTRPRPPAACRHGDQPASSRTLEDVAAAQPSAPARAREELDADKRRRPRHSEETKTKISRALLGRVKEAQTRERISKTMKGRVPWNKGKKMSDETRAKMSQARMGMEPWNKGNELSPEHRRRIGRAMTGKSIPDRTKLRMTFARRRPVDGIVGATKPPANMERGEYPLMDTEDIHEFVALRRRLTSWSDNWQSIKGRRPSMADIRRHAPIELVSMFEKYVEMRGRLRGLTADVVVGSVDPSAIPATAPGERKPKTGAVFVDPTQQAQVDGVTQSGFLSVNAESSDGSSHEEEPRLSRDDYRMIGKYRLMGSRDIHSFVRMRRELREWSDDFRRTHGRTPAVSDAKLVSPQLYNKCLQYLKNRNRIIGLVKEVYGGRQSTQENREESVSEDGKDQRRAQWIEDRIL